MSVRNFTASEERAEIERLARLLCRASHASIDPDMLCLTGEPIRLRHGPAVVGTTMPLWCFYNGAAKAIFDDQRRQEELAGQLTGEYDEHV